MLSIFFLADLFDPVGEPGVPLVQVIEIEAAQAQRAQRVFGRGAVAGPFSLHKIKQKSAKGIGPGGFQVTAFDFVVPELPVMLPLFVQVMVKIGEPEDRRFADIDRDITALNVVAGKIADPVRQ